MGHFNVFSLADLREALSMTFNRRAYYKMTFCYGRSQVEYADQAAHVGANTSFLVTPQLDSLALGKRSFINKPH